LTLWDVADSLIGMPAFVECVGDGGFQLVYAVTVDRVNKLSVNVTVCGVVIGPPVTVMSRYDAINGSNHVASYDVGPDNKYGMAVNADRSMMAVSYGGDVSPFGGFLRPSQNIHVFQLTPSFQRACVIGREGTGPAEFDGPYRLCFTDDDTILVCDYDNNRVQHLTVVGEYIRSFAVRLPFSIAVHGDMVAVGTADGPIEIHSLSTGELISRFGSRGEGPGKIGRYATGIRLTPDGTCLLVAEYRNGRLSLFTVDGVFVKHIGAGELAKGPKDVSFGAGGEIIVADSGNHRICVFSPDGDTLIRTWGSYGTAAGQFEYPRALAVSGLYLYVMDHTRVQVFE
jgi:DNA-binding beta-propeller fold protein YncE